MGEGFKTRRGDSKGSIKTYLYNAGDECTSLTGGWSIGINVGGALRTAINDAVNGKLYLTAQGNTTLSAEISMVTVNAIDVTPYNTLKFKLTTTGLGESAPYMNSLAVGLTKSRTTNNYNYLPITLLKTNVTEHIVSVDVSAVNGSLYVAIGCYAGLYPSYPTEYISCYEAYFE